MWRFIGLVIILHSAYQPVQSVKKSLAKTVTLFCSRGSPQEYILVQKLHTREHSDVILARKLLADTKPQEPPQPITDERVDTIPVPEPDTNKPTEQPLINPDGKIELPAEVVLKFCIQSRKNDGSVTLIVEYNNYMYLDLKTKALPQFLPDAFFRSEDSQAPSSKPIPNTVEKDRQDQPEQKNSRRPLQAIRDTLKKLIDRTIGKIVLSNKSRSAGCSSDLSKNQEKLPHQTNVPDKADSSIPNVDESQDQKPVETRPATTPPPLPPLPPTPSPVPVGTNNDTEIKSNTDEYDSFGFPVITDDIKDNMLQKLNQLGGDHDQGDSPGSVVPEVFRKVPRNVTVYFRENLILYADVTEALETLGIELLGADLHTKYIEPAIRISLSLALTYAIQLLVTLDRYQQIDFVHLDLKPRNIVLDPTDPNGESVMIIDPACGKYEEKLGEGTPGSTFYANPKVMRGSLSTHFNDDALAAVYITFELVTGFLPWEKEDGQEELIAKMNKFGDDLENIADSAVEGADKNYYTEVGKILADMKQDAISMDRSFQTRFPYQKYIGLLYSVWARLTGATRL